MCNVCLLNATNSLLYPAVLERERELRACSSVGGSKRRRIRLEHIIHVVYQRSHTSVNRLGVQLFIASYDPF